MKCILLLQKKKEHKTGRKNRKQIVRMENMQPNVSAK